ncbi:hypothetical protein ACYFX5_00780 [Bremerella sp. T1]|uniref:hypothetical protein n=1 Tax=Bremerella sp. TYQ1 TaxID=3119568 RepID=UPI001CCF7E61|nr:hypothetical protein [Bremerella volcania]UBM36825.1 hypothetical protein LA756_02740 [Bremerella volcania]
MKARFLLSGLALLAITTVSLMAADINLDDVKCIMNPKAAAKADKSLEYKGGEVFFCCNNCPKGFAKKVEAKDKLVMAKGNHQLVATKQAKQEHCPFTGGPMKTELTVEGATVKFCCNNCKGKAEGLEGEEQITALFGEKAWEKAGFEVADAKKTETK